MPRTRVLHLEDEPTDSELVQLWLRDAGLDWDVARVQSRAEFTAAVEEGLFDIILSDYGLPAFDGLEALRHARARRPDVAFVFFTATLGEERAVDALKAGATDFVVKMRPERLVPALMRAMKEGEDRAARRRAEEALREREESFRLLFESNPHPMWVFDVDTLAFLEVNAAAVEHYGYSRDEFLSMRLVDIRPSEEIARLEEAVREARSDGAVHRSGPWRHRLKDGRLIDVEVVTHNLAFAGRRGRLVVAHDVTDRKRLEAELLQSQKLEAIGQLAAGVAHDFNNLLNVIGGYGSILLKGAPPADPSRTRLEQILRAAERGAALTRQLLAFSRKQALELKVLDPNAVVTEIEPMLRRLLGESVHLQVALAADLGRVKADPGQVEQILMNLAINARDAMPRGGTLVIETANVDFDAGSVRTHPGSAPGPYVRLAVSDTGEGMSAQVQARIFEPFFTTKPRGKGTGLGLATLYGIVKQSGGLVDVYSEPGHGTTFKIYFPLVDEALAPAAPGPDAATPGGSETILLVEDDDALRALTREMLEERGYVVLDASDAEAALLAARSYPGPIHLLMTDVVLPRMSGGDLAQRLGANRPRTRVLYMSGYTGEAVDRQARLERPVTFISKPFTLADLLRKVRAALDG